MTLQKRTTKSRTAVRARQAGNKSQFDQTIEAIAQIEHEAYASRSRMDHVAGIITQAAGTAPAILIHVIWFLAWILANVRALPGIEPFDPFPFSLLTTIVSLEAIFLTLFVLVSQNRMSREADKRAELDLEVNLLAERETTMILRILHEMSGKLGVTGPATKDLQELLKETKLKDLADKLESALPSK